MTADGASPIRLLYIDDDPALGRLVGRTLGRHGYHVVPVESGDLGLARLTSERFDAIALDHFMPDREGLDVLAEIQALESPPPVIYVTGANEGRIAVSALKAGAADYVIKDVGGVFLDLLRTAVEQAIEAVRLRQLKEAAEAEMRDARARAEMLLREVNHRVANSLQLVASLVAMQQRGVDDPAARAALAETQGRIAAIAQIHKRLYTSKDVSAVEMDSYMHGLVAELEAAMSASGRAHRLTLLADPVRIPTDQAVSVGVVVAELVTNAYKYAYPDGTGEIRVSLTRGDDALVLAVEDDGVGIRGGEGARSGSGLGMRVVRAMLDTLKSAATIDPAHRGTRVVMRMPLPDEHEVSEAVAAQA
ncbi:histidine kinase dimerization/phosphoacceptor domain -containing protein [Chthonobacter rhizosphaerae]|uniref:histidine kinase dimerization/phosphoacceptor domain -containing protein n=1 Tax=Chthonobacter rhizosphaerae TaxID=2735553 RepID=UPI0015EE8520